MIAGRELHALSQNGWPEDYITNVVIAREKEEEEEEAESVTVGGWDTLA